MNRQVKPGQYDYDAYVVYNPCGADLEFVQLMTRVLQSAPYNLRLFVPWTEFTDADFEPYLSAEIIEKRCSKVIVVVSKDALESDIFHLQMKIAHSISPGCRGKRVIPVRLDDSELPAILKFTTSCDYYKSDLRVWIWDRIFSAFSNQMYKFTRMEKYKIREKSLIVLDEFDAFVIFHPFGKDLIFTKKMTSALESVPYKLRVCLLWLEKGILNFPLDVLSDIIEKRCQKIIIILSEEAIKNPMFQFHLLFAHALSPGARQKKVIPVRLDRSELPEMIRSITSCDYYKTTSRNWIWNRIYSSFSDNIFTPLS